MTPCPRPRRLERAAHRLLLAPLHRREGWHPPGHRAARTPQQCPQRGRGRHFRQVGPPAWPLCCAWRLRLWRQQKGPRTKSRVAQRVKCMPAARETRVRSLGREDPLEKGMATHCSILAWRIPWTEEPGGLQSMRSLRVGQQLSNFLKIKIPGAARVPQLPLRCLSLHIRVWEGKRPHL